MRRDDADSPVGAAFMPLVRKYPLLSFLLLTFFISWGLGALYFFFPEQVVTLTGENVDRYHPLFAVLFVAPFLTLPTSMAPAHQPD